MVITSFAGAHWSNNLLIDEATLESKRVRIPLPPKVFVQDPSPESFFEAVYSALGVKSGTKIYSVISPDSYIAGKIKNPSVKSMSLDDAISEFEFPKPFLWIEENFYYTNKSKGELKVSPTYLFNRFFLENNYFVSENILKNVELYGQRKPASEYEKNFESAVTGAIFKSAVGQAYGNIMKSEREIFLTGPFYNLEDGIVKILLNLLESINHPGIWDVFVDMQDSFTSLLPLHSFDKKLFGKMLDKRPPSQSATLLVIPGAKLIELDFEIDEITKTEIGDKSVSLVPVPPGEKVKVKITGKNKSVEAVVKGSRYGMLVDGRPRPLLEPDSKAALKKSFEELEAVIKGQIN